jgi:hypothetical protein
MANTATAIFFNDVDNTDGRITIGQQDFLDKILKTTLTTTAWIQDNPFTIEAWVNHTGSFIDTTSYNPFLACTKLYG